MTASLPTVSVPLRYDDDGTIYIGQTKITLELIVRAFRLGEAPEHIKENYSILSLADVYAVCAYYLQHRTELDAYLVKQEEAEERLAAQAKERYPLSDSLKAKLRAKSRQ